MRFARQSIISLGVSSRTVSRAARIQMISNLSNIPEQKQTLLRALVTKLSKIPGMAAIVLGGSYAARTNHETSDLDIGLYYYEAKPFSIEDIYRIAQRVSVEKSLTVT